MKSRFILVVVLILVVVIVGVLFLRRFNRKAPEPVRVEQTISNKQHQPMKTGAVARVTQSPMPTAGTTLATEDDTQHYLRAAESVRENAKSEQIPLDFYGRVVDENDTGIEGVKATFSYTHFDVTQPFYFFRGTSDRFLMSDSGGHFAIRGVKGYGFSVNLEKEGYDPSAGNFHGGMIVGGPMKPVKTSAAVPMIFRMRKKGAPEPLIYFKCDYGLARDGTPKLINLVTGRTNNLVADLKVQAWTDDQHKDKDFRYDFRVRIEVMNGGLVESVKEFDYTAPDTGYVSSYEIDSPASLADAWSKWPMRKFLLRLRSGKLYGRMVFTMVAGGDHFCTIESWLNPTGSHNLETDPKLTFPDLESYNRYMVKTGGKPVSLEPSPPKP